MAKSLTGTVGTDSTQTNRATVASPISAAAQTQSARGIRPRADKLPRHLEELRELGGQDGVAGDLQLAAEEERHGGLHAAVEHAAKVIIARLDRALRGPVLADHAGRRRRNQIDRPGAPVSAADLEKVDGSHVLGLLGAGGENGGDFLVEE